MMKRAFFFAGLFGLPAAAMGDDARALKLDRLEMSGSVIIKPQRIDDLTVKGFSALAWDEDLQVLHAVTDKGRIVRYRLTIEKDRLTAITVEKVVRATNEAGENIKKKLADFEGATTIANPDKNAIGAELLLAMEFPPAIYRASMDGEVIERLQLPDTLLDPAAFRDGSNGVEAVVVHPEFGVLTAPEEPLLTDDSRGQTVYALDGRRFIIPRHSLGRGNIKALEVLSDGSLVIMLRFRIDGTRLKTVLRRVDLKSCDAEQRCSAEDIPVGPDPLPELNFEGLAFLPGGFLALISDDKPATGPQSELHLLRIHAATR